MQDPAPVFEHLSAGLASLVAPRRCAACRCSLPPRTRAPWWEHLCRSCRARLEPIQGACRGCGRGLGPYAADAARCPACRRQPLGGVRSTTALLRYRGPGRALLRQLKYSGCDGLGRPLGLDLGRRFAERAPDLARDPDLWVVAVPLHVVRRWRRGYNQSEEVAAGVAAALGRPLVRALGRTRATRPLYGVRREAREALVEGAFTAVRGVDLRGRPVALVDDIRTSGSTLRAAAAALMAAGSGRIDALVVAR